MSFDPLTRLHTAVGKLILAWASIDNSLALAVTSIHADLVRYGYLPEPLPSGFEKRLRLLRFWFKEFVQEPGRYEPGIQALNTISRIKKLRDNCAHGVLSFDALYSDEAVYIAGSWLRRHPTDFAKSQRELSERMRGRRVALSSIERDVSALDGMAGAITFVRGSIQRILRLRHDPIP